MQKSYSTFPGGRFGIGLLILRMAAGIAAGCFGVVILSSLEPFTKNQFSSLGHLILGLLLVAGGILMVLGLMTPFVSIALAACELTAAVVRPVPAEALEKFDFGPTLLVLLASVAAALVLLGPGALSIDARLYGHQRIFLPSSKKQNEHRNS